MMRPPLFLRRRFLFLALVTGCSPAADAAPRALIAFPLQQQQQPMLSPAPPSRPPRAWATWPEMNAMKLSGADSAVWRLVTAAYPYSRPLSRLLSEHLVTTRREKYGETTVLLVTRLQDDTGFDAYEYRIGSKGRRTRDTVLFDYATHGSGEPSLSEERVTAVRKAVKSLPPSSDPPPKNVRDLVIVTYAGGRGYVTRVYDARKMPPALAELGKNFRKHDPPFPAPQPFPPPQKSP